MPRKLATLNVHGRNYVEYSCTTSDSDGTTENAPYLRIYGTCRSARIEHVGPGKSKARVTTDRRP